MKDFRFKKAEIGVLCEELDWPGLSARNEYRCNRTTAMSLFLFRLATNCSWYEQEIKFGLFTSQLSEVFWEHVEIAEERYGHVLNRRPVLLRNNAVRYAQILIEKGFLYDSCVGFIDCRKIRICRQQAQILPNEQIIKS